MRDGVAGARSGKGFRAKRAVPQARRALRACVAVCLLCFGACALDGAGKAASAGLRVARAVEYVQTGNSPEPSLFAGGDAGALGMNPAGGGAEVPSWFADELFPLEDCRSVAVAAGGSVVGFEADGSAAQAYAGIVEKMEDRGWTEVGSGLAGNGAFVKDDGCCRWAWVSCTDVSGVASVVVQCAHGDGGTE